MYEGYPYYMCLQNQGKNFEVKKKVSESGVSGVDPGFFFRGGGGYQFELTSNIGGGGGTSVQKQ